MKIIEVSETPVVFLGLGVAHRVDVAKTLCFPRVLRAMFQNLVFFYVLGATPGVTGVTRLHRFPYQIRQNLYSENTVWGIKLPHNSSTHIYLWAHGAP